jgi:uncharacterized protein (TIGR02117 family)
MVGFGWGDRNFYLTTPGWDQVRASTALDALFGGGPTVVHVARMADPDRLAGCRRLPVSRDQLGRLEAHVLDSLARDRDGAVVAIPDAGYGVDDGFLVATGHYSIVTTCNEWVRRGLARAGVRTALWAPLPAPLLWQADAVKGAEAPD